MDEGICASREGIHKLCRFCECGSVLRQHGVVDLKITVEVKMIVDDQMELDDEMTAYQLHTVLVHRL